MDATWIGPMGAAAAAVIAGVVAIYVQRRNQAADAAQRAAEAAEQARQRAADAAEQARQREADAANRALDRTVEAEQRVAEASHRGAALVGVVRAAWQEWITYLKNVTTDASNERFAELDDFDLKCAELRQGAHQALAEVRPDISHRLFYGDFATSLRSTEAEVRDILTGRSSDGARQLLDRTHSFEVLISLRHDVTRDAIFRILGGHW
ncbi:hypothetical protein P8605_02415 [Streptomyces sp. T-3]|nr:hypothetical protein [Streptomyces sp. T-3]